VKFVINREPAYDHYGHGIGHVAPDAARRAGVRDRSYSQRVIGDHSQAGANDIGAGCAALLVLQGSAPQPVIQSRLAASES
jgi:hypothetical protein